MEEERKRCSRCGVDHPPRFFHQHRRASHNGYVVEYETVCKECRVKERRAKKEENPFRPKARATLAYHAEKACQTTPQFSHNSGVTLDYLEMLFRDAWISHKNGSRCHSCNNAFENDLEDFHLDVIDSRRQITRSNIRVICKDCNIAKRQIDPTEYDLDSLEYDRNKEVIKQAIQFNLSEVESNIPTQPRVFSS